jgi:hypothetical protein
LQLGEGFFLSSNTQYFNELNALSALPSKTIVSPPGAFFKASSIILLDSVSGTVCSVLYTQTLELQLLVFTLLNQESACIPCVMSSSSLAIVSSASLNV